jgi:hypothetical protein
MNRVVFRLTYVALNDIQEQADWYEQQSGQALVKRWEYEVTAALIRIEKIPARAQNATSTLTSFKAFGGCQLPVFPDI